MFIESASSIIIPSKIRILPLINRSETVKEMMLVYNLLLHHLLVYTQLPAGISFFSTYDRTSTRSSRVDMSINGKFRGN